MRTFVVDLTAGGKLSDLMKAQFNEGPLRCAKIGIQNLSTSGTAFYLGGIGNPAHEMLPGQTTVWPVGNTKNIEFAPAAVDAIISLFSEN